MSDSAIVEILLKAKDESSGAFESMRSHLDGLHEHLSRIKDIALGNILGGLGVTAFQETLGGVERLGEGLITVNADMESLRQRLNVLYGSAAEGQQAFAFMLQNEQHVPFDVNSIVQASTTLVSFGADITEVLPRLENLAGAMGQSLPVAAQALTDAMAGRTAMMQRDLRINKEELEQFGLQVTGTGHIIQSTLLPAFERLVDARFAGGIAAQANTFNGLMSSLKSQFQYAEMNVGAGLFGQVKTGLADLVHGLQNNSAEVQKFELAIGAALAAAMTSAVDFAKTFGPYIGSAIVLGARAFDLIHQGTLLAFNAAGVVISTFANWLRGTAFPTIEIVINAIAVAWMKLSPVVIGVLSAIGADFSRAFTAIGGIAAGFFQGLAGAFEIGMGAVQIILGGTLDLLSGNWAGFQNDINAGANVIVRGIVEMVGGMSIAMLPLAENLLNPWTKLAQGIRSVFTAIAPFVGALMGAVALAVTTPITLIVTQINTVIVAVNAAIHMATGAIDAMIDKYNGIAGKIPGMGGHKIGKIGGGADVSTIDFGPAGIFTGVNDAVQKALKGVGIGPDQQIVAGRSRADAEADIKATMARILTEAGITPGTATGQKYDTTGGPGQQILSQITNLFKDIGGKMTLPDFMRAMGFTDLGKGLLQYTGAGAGAGNLAYQGGKLPVNAFTPTAEGAAGGASGPSYTFPAIAQNLGALAASFGGTRVTPGGGGGEQEKERQMQRQIAELTKANASLQAQLAQRTTEENLLRSLYHVGDLSRGSLEALAQKLIPLPQPRVSLHRAIGPV